MNTKILLVGQIYAVAKKSFKEEETTYVQFLNKNENGGVEIVSVKLTEEIDIKNIKENILVQIPVKISSFNNKLFYTQIDKIVKQQ